MKVTYYGHSCFLVDINGSKLLFDPFISPNELAKNIDPTTIACDYILVSHGHEDHTADLVSIAKRTNAKVICSWEIYVWLGKKGITNAHPMNTGGKWSFDNFDVRCTVAQHSSGLPDGSYGGSPMGFLVTSQGGNFYYSGDTGLTLDMKLIRDWCPNLHLALMPIGDNFTMDSQDAAIASEWVGTTDVVGLHFDTFGFIKIDHAAARQTFASRNINLHLLPIGGSQVF